MRDHLVWRLIVGLFLIGGAFAASCFTILTDESLFSGGSGNIAMSWTVFEQPWQVLSGYYSGIMLWSIVGSWLIYFCYILLSVANSFAHDRGMTTITYVLVAIDSIGNFLYFKTMPLLYASLLTGLVFFILTYGGKHGVSLVLGAFSEFQKAKKARVAYEDD